MLYFIAVIMLAIGIALIFLEENCYTDTVFGIMITTISGAAVADIKNAPLDELVRNTDELLIRCDIEKTVESCDECGFCKVKNEREEEK